MILTSEAFSRLKKRAWKWLRTPGESLSIGIPHAEEDAVTTPKGNAANHFSVRVFPFRVIRVIRGENWSA